MAGPLFPWTVHHQRSRPELPDPSASHCLIPAGSTQVLPRDGLCKSVRRITRRDTLVHYFYFMFLILLLAYKLL